MCGLIHEQNCSNVEMWLELLVASLLLFLWDGEFYCVVLLYMVPRGNIYIYVTNTDELKHTQWPCPYIKECI